MPRLLRDVILEHAAAQIWNGDDSLLGLLKPARVLSTILGAESPIQGERSTSAMIATNLDNMSEICTFMIERKSHAICGICLFDLKNLQLCLSIFCFVI